MTDTSGSTLTPAQAAANQQATVDLAVAQARTAAIGADSAALTLAQAKYKSLVPDFTGVAMNSVTDSSTGVAFSGLVTYSALNHAAQIVANRISDVLPEPADGKRPVILVTSESDLLTNDLLLSAVKTGIAQIADLGKKVVNMYGPPGTPGKKQLKDPGLSGGKENIEVEDVPAPTTPSPGVGAAGVAAEVAAGAPFGPLGVAAAGAAAIPSIISLFSTTTTVKDQTMDITGLATTTAVIAAASRKLPNHVLVHEDFRLAPTRSAVVDDFNLLSRIRTDLLFRQETVQVTKNDADLQVAEAQLQIDTAAKATPAASVDEAVQQQLTEGTNASANAAAELTLISSTINDIETFATAMNAVAAGSRSPLAIAALTELLHETAETGGVSFVLSVTGLGGQSEEFTKDRHLGHSGYTTLADASISFMLYEIASRSIIGAGVANGVSSVHGNLGEPPTGLIGSNVEDAVDNETAAAAEGSPSESLPSSTGTEVPQKHSHPGWLRMFGPIRHLVPRH